MKPRETYKITAVRLVEFHNLGTTTIEIPNGGHLFLLGDNGSGKTTILDAIHLVLTAGREMEFNSAARVAGAKDSGGRTIQGSRDASIRKRTDRLNFPQAVIRNSAISRTLCRSSNTSGLGTVSGRRSSLNCAESLRASLHRWK